MCSGLWMIVWAFAFSDFLLQITPWASSSLYEKFEDPKWKSEDSYRKRKRINDLYVAAL
jgi:hypothetical protein